MQVSFAPAVPEYAPVVVRSKRGTRVLYVALLVATVLCGLVVAGQPVLVVAAGPIALPLLGALPLQVIQLWLTIRVLREYQGLLTPQLAADATGMWVRTGTGPRPEVVHLPWAAIEGIDAGRKGRVVRIMSPCGEELLAPRRHWRARTLHRRFGTSFVVDGRRSAQPPDAIVALLHGFPRRLTR